MDPLDPRACPKLVFRVRETLLLPLETPWGVYSGAEKAPAGMGTRTSWLWGAILGPKKPLRARGHALPGFGGGTGLEPGASGVRRLRANPLGNLCTIPMEGP